MLPSCFQRTFARLNGVFTLLIVVLLAAGLFILPDTRVQASRGQFIPIIEQPLRPFTDPNGVEYDWFGRSVAVDGNTMVIGNFEDDLGEVLIYELQGSRWVYQGKLTSPEGLTKDCFGNSVAVSGDTVVVGAEGAEVMVDGVLHDNQGAAYVFRRPAAGWSAAPTEIVKLTASDGTEDDYFGSAVAIDGDTIVVGAMLHDEVVNGVTVPSKGAAYVFVKPTIIATSTSYLTEVTKLTASDIAFEYCFGCWVAVDGDTVVVGMNVIRVNTALRIVAYVFVKPGSVWPEQTTLSEAARLIPSDTAWAKCFICSVDIDGDTIVIGSPNVNEPNGGGLYVFDRPGGGWMGTLNQAARLVVTDTGFFGLGSSVAIKGDTIVSGTVYDDIGSNNEQGSVIVFIREGTQWANTSRYDAKLTASDGAAEDFLGWSIDFDGSTLLVGAPKRDVNGVVDQGAAYANGVGQPTAVLISAFEANTTGQGVRLAWQAARWRDLVGFNVYRSIGVEGAKVKLNQSLIGVEAGGEYYFDVGVGQLEDVYWVERVGAGDSRFYGPVMVDWRRGFLPVVW